MAIKGQYEISDEGVTVRCVCGEKYTQLGGSSGFRLAGHLLSEMIRDPASCDVRYTPSQSQQFLREIDAETDLAR